MSLLSEVGTNYKDHVSRRKFEAVRDFGIAYFARSDQFACGLQFWAGGFMNSAVDASAAFEISSRGVHNCVYC